MERRKATHNTCSATRCTLCPLRRRSWCVHSEEEEEEEGQTAEHLQYLLKKGLEEEEVEYVRVCACMCVCVCVCMYVCSVFSPTCEATKEIKVRAAISMYLYWWSCVLILALSLVLFVYL